MPNKPTDSDLIRLLIAQQKAESNFKADAVSPVGAVGLAQFMPGTWEMALKRGWVAPGSSPNDPKAAAEAQKNYMEWLLERPYINGDIEKAIAAYNWGQGNIQKVTKKYGDDWINHLPNETSTYLKRIKKYYKDPSLKSPYQETPQYTSDIFNSTKEDNNSYGFINSEDLGIEYDIPVMAQDNTSVDNYVSRIQPALDDLWKRTIEAGKDVNLDQYKGTPEPEVDDALWERTMEQVNSVNLPGNQRTRKMAGGGPLSINIGNSTIYGVDNMEDYRTAYNENRVLNYNKDGQLEKTLDPVTIVADRKTGKQYPYYDQLTKEEQKYFNNNGSIGSYVRGKAELGKSPVPYTQGIGQILAGYGNFAAELTGIPGAIRFVKDPVNSLKGTGNTLTDLLLTSGLASGTHAGAINYVTMGTNPFTGQKPFRGQDVEGAFNTLDALGIATVLGSPLKAPFQAGLKQATTKTPLRNAYKLNPWAFKPNPNNYYRMGKGKSFIDDVLQTNKIRAYNENSYANLRAAGKISGLREDGKIVLKAKTFPEADTYWAKGVPLDGRYASQNYGNYMIEASNEIPFIHAVNQRTRQKGFWDAPDVNYNSSHTKGNYVKPRQSYDYNIEGKIKPSIGTPLEYNPNLIKLYKQDWLRGYKPIEVPRQLPGSPNTVSVVDDVSRVVADTPQPWQMQELPGLHLKSTMPDGPISKIVEPKTGLINTEQALAIIGKESGGANKVALIRQGLGENIPKKMDYNEFRKTVQDQLIPLERQFVDHSSNYGVNRLGYKEPEFITRTVDGKIINEMTSDVIENQTLILGNKSKFGRGSSAHGNPDETLGHAHFLRDAETPDVLTVTQIQSDAFQGTHRTSMKTKEQAKLSYDRQLEHYNKNKDKIEGIKKIDENTYQFPDGQKISKSAYENMFSGLDESLALSKADLENFTQKQLLDKNHQERYLQELVDYAGKRGDVNKVRVPTSETAAKVQGYSKIELTGDNTPGFAELQEKISIAVRQGNQKEVDELMKIHDKMLNTPYKKYSNEHQTILKKYSQQPKTIKKLFGKEPTIVTDSKGNTWYEFDIPEKFKQGKGEIKAYQRGGLLPKAAMDNLRSDPTDDMIDWMIITQDLDRFFKKSATLENRREAIRRLYSGAGLVGTGTAAYKSIDTQDQSQKTKMEKGGPLGLVGPLGLAMTALNSVGSSGIKNNTPISYGEGKNNSYYYSAKYPDKLSYKEPEQITKTKNFQKENNIPPTGFAGEKTIHTHMANRGIDGKKLKNDPNYSPEYTSVDYQNLQKSVKAWEDNVVKVLNDAKESGEFSPGQETIDNYKNQIENKDQKLAYCISGVCRNLLNADPTSLEGGKNRFEDIYFSNTAFEENAEAMGWSPPYKGKNAVENVNIGDVFQIIYPDKSRHALIVKGTDEYGNIITAHNGGGTKYKEKTLSPEAMLNRYNMNGSKLQRFSRYEFIGEDGKTYNKKDYMRGSTPYINEYVKSKKEFVIDHNKIDALDGRSERMENWIKETLPKKRHKKAFEFYEGISDEFEGNVSEQDAQNLVDIGMAIMFHESGYGDNDTQRLRAKKNAGVLARLYRTTGVSGGKQPFNQALSGGLSQIDPKWIDTDIRNKFFPEYLENTDKNNRKITRRLFRDKELAGKVSQDLLIRRYNNLRNNPNLYGNDPKLFWYALAATWQNPNAASKAYDPEEHGPSNIYKKGDNFLQNFDLFYSDEVFKYVPTDVK